MSKLHKGPDTEQRLKWKIADHCKREGCTKVVNNRFQLCLEHRKELCPRCEKTIGILTHGVCAPCMQKAKRRGGDHGVL